MTSWMWLPGCERKPVWVPCSPPGVLWPSICKFQVQLWEPDFAAAENRSSCGVDREKQDSEATFRRLKNNDNNFKNEFRRKFKAWKACYCENLEQLFIFFCKTVREVKTWRLSRRFKIFANSLKGIDNDTRTVQTKKQLLEVDKRRLLLLLDNSLDNLDFIAFFKLHHIHSHTTRISLKCKQMTTGAHSNDEETEKKFEAKMRESWPHVVT